MVEMWRIWELVRPGGRYKPASHVGNTGSIPVGTTILCAATPTTSRSSSEEEPFRFIGEGSAVQGILWGVVNLLVEAGDHLKACAECGKPFVSRKRQEDCSGACSQRLCDRKKLEKKKQGQGKA